MAVRVVRKIGDPLLRGKARAVTVEEVKSGGLAGLLVDMIDTMRAEGGIGIAAPQIGESVRVAVIEIDRASTRYPNMTPFARSVFVNPAVTVLDASEQSHWEGCLSVPVLRGLVPRPRAVRVDFLDETGESRSLSAEGFLATVLQHELDHLDGILFVDRVRDTSKLSTLENLIEYRLAGEPQLDDGK
jgi:peptide deformylase